MTPRTVDWRSVRAKLRRIRELLDQLQSFGPVDEARLVADPVVELAIERILTLLVDLAFAGNSHSKRTGAWWPRPYRSHWTSTGST